MDELADNFFNTPGSLNPSIWKPASAVASIRVDIGEVRCRRSFAQSFEKITFNLILSDADPSSRSPHLSQQTDNAYNIKADLPGIPKENINLSFDDGNLVISAERKEEQEKKEGDEKNPTYYYKELNYGKVYRSFRLPVEADISTAQAKFENGCLSVTIPKKSLPSSQTIEIN